MEKGLLISAVERLCPPDSLAGFPLSPIFTRAGAGMTGAQPHFTRTTWFGDVLGRAGDNEPHQTAQHALHLFQLKAGTCH